MQAENELTVLDIRDSYLEWNKQQLNRLDDIGPELSALIKLIPLMLQVNSRSLPGYSGADVPMGVHRYTPEVSTIRLAKSLNSKFEYSLQERIKFPVIDSVFFEFCMLDMVKRCWVFVRDSLDAKQLSEIKVKTENISKWYRAKGLSIDFLLITEAKFNKFKINKVSQLNKSIFLRQFYAESILLAGKIPFWWLVPPESENDYKNHVEYISKARFIEPQDCIDLGGINDLTPYDFLRQAVKYVQHAKNEPDLSLVNLALLDMQIDCWPENDCLAYRIKQQIYQSAELTDNYTKLAEILFESFERLSKKNRIMPMDRLLSSLKNMPGKLNHELIDAYVGERHFQPMALKGIDNIIAFMNVNKALIFSIREIFSRILDAFNQNTDVLDKQKGVVEHAAEMLSSLSESANRIPVYNRQAIPDILLDKILIRHVFVSSEESYWSLVIKRSDTLEKKIEGFTSLLGLLTWCWLNRLVSHATQVSIDCPMLQVRQIEARYVLETIMQHIDPSLVDNVAPSALEKPVLPVISLVLVNAVPVSTNSSDLLSAKNVLLEFEKYAVHPHVYCDQVSVDSWGGVSTRSSQGGFAILNCLCDWTHHASLDRRRPPKTIYFSGYGTGDSTHMAYRLQEIYDAVIEYFYVARQLSGRFVIKLEDAFYTISARNKQLVVEELGDERAMFKFLAASAAEFRPTQMERLAYTEYPLKEIYQQNRADVFQVFFQIINGVCHTWVLDENGSLFRDKQAAVDRNAYVLHWFYFFKNMLPRLDSLGFSGDKKPTIEISHIALNRLGAYEFVSVSAASLPTDKNFYETGLKITHQESTEQLTLVCEDTEFSYQQYQLAVVNACVDELQKKFKSQGRMDVYVTDIDASLETFNAGGKVQLIQILQLKRAFEKRINGMLNE